MNWENRVEQLINTKFELIISSGLVLELMKVYSVLYLNSATPSACSKCQQGYYNQLNINGIKKAKKMDKRGKKTCKCKRKGLKFVPKFGHYNLELITDKEATLLINEGWLKESDFEILPEIVEVLEETEISEKTEVPEETEKPKHNQNRKRKNRK